VAPDPLLATAALLVTIRFEAGLVIRPLGDDEVNRKRNCFPDAPVADQRSPSACSAQAV
jgi:hypothetical protein